jgi:hypothetical protein
VGEEYRSKKQTQNTVLVVSFLLCIWYDIHKWLHNIQSNTAKFFIIRKATCFGISQTAIVRPSNRQLVY